MTSKISFVNGRAEVRRREPSRSSYPMDSHQQGAPQPHGPPAGTQVSFVDGKCTCCPYGYHIDLDFLNFCRDVESGSTLKNLKRIQRAKRKLRKSMEIMLDEQEGIAADPNSAPPDVVHSTEAGRLMHMINYERSASHRILNQIDSSVGGRDVRNMSSDSEEGFTPITPAYGYSYHQQAIDNGRHFSNHGRTDSISSLSSVSSVNSEVPMMYQTYLQQQQQLNLGQHQQQQTQQTQQQLNLYQHQQQQQQQQLSLHQYQQQQQQFNHHQQQQHQDQEYVKTTTVVTTTEVTENPVLEMATAEMKTYQSNPVVEMGTAEMKSKPPPPPPKDEVTRQKYLSHLSAQLVDNGVDMPDTRQPPRASPDVNQMSLQSVREAMAVSLQRMRELEEQVKAIPILQVRISVLKEEKRLLNLQLKASQANTSELLQKKTPPPTPPKPVRTFSVGVGDHSIIDPYLLQPHLSTGYTICENHTHTELHSSTTVIEQETIRNRIPSLSVSFKQPSFEERESRFSSNTVSDSTSPLFTINQIQRSTPKPFTRSVGTGDANVFEGSGLHVHEKEFRTVFIGQGANVAMRNVGIQCKVPTREVGVSFMVDEEKPETRTIGVNVNCDTSNVHTSLDFKGETELRMALRGVLQRKVHSVATNCNFRVPTVDSGTSMDQSSGISVGCGDDDHRTDVEIRMPVVRRAVAVSVKPETSQKCVSTEKGWMMDAGTNTLQAEKYQKSTMTERQRCSFAATNTETILQRQANCQTDTKMFMALEWLKNAANNTEKTPTCSTGMVTDVRPTAHVAVNTTKEKTAVSTVGVNTNEQVTPISHVGVNTVVEEKPVRNVAVNTQDVVKQVASVNTIEKVSDLFQRTDIQQTSLPKKVLTIDRGVGEDVVEDPYMFSETVEVVHTVPVTQILTKEEQIIQRGANQANAFLIQSTDSFDQREDSNYIDQYSITSVKGLESISNNETVKNLESSDYRIKSNTEGVSTDANFSTSSLSSSFSSSFNSNVSSGRSSMSEGFVSGNSINSGQTSMTGISAVDSGEGNEQQDLKTIRISRESSPGKDEDGYSQTVVEHYIITDEGKTLISKELTRSVVSDGKNITNHEVVDGGRLSSSSLSSQNSQKNVTNEGTDRVKLYSSSMSSGKSVDTERSLDSGNLHSGTVYTSSFHSDAKIKPNDWFTDSSNSKIRTHSSTSYYRDKKLKPAEWFSDSVTLQSSSSISPPSSESKPPTAEENTGGQRLQSSSVTSSAHYYSDGKSTTTQEITNGGNLQSSSSFSPTHHSYESKQYNGVSEQRISDSSNDGESYKQLITIALDVDNDNSQDRDHKNVSVSDGYLSYGTSQSSTYSSTSTTSSCSSEQQQSVVSDVSSGVRTEKSSSSVVTNPYKTVENLAAASSIESDSLDGSSSSRLMSKTSSEGNLFSKTSRGRVEAVQSLDTAVYDLRRAGSVEDFMPDDIRKYMSIDPSNSKDSGFGEDLLQRFSEQSVSSSNTSSTSISTDKARSMKYMVSKTVTTKRTTRSGDKVLVCETKTIEGPDGEKTTTVMETEDGKPIQRLESNSSQDNDLVKEAGFSSSSYSSSFASSSDSTPELSKSVDELFPSNEESMSFSEAFSGLTFSSTSSVDPSYGSLDRNTRQVKSILKQTRSESCSSKKGISFAETVTGGMGSSSEGEDDEDTDSTASFEEGSYDSQQGAVIYRCRDDEAIAQGLPGAQMFDQNIRETYELSEDVSQSCKTLATYLMDSTTIQTKQLNASLNVIQQEWFQVSSHKLSSPHQVEDFLSSVNEISKRLLEYIVNMTDANGNTAIHYCISHCNFEIANLLLDSEVCDINKTNKAGYTPIMLAGLATLQNLEQREIVRRLFSMGDINARATATNQTALMLAASHGRTETVRLLSEEGADLNLQDVDGSTALMCACEHGHLEIVTFLLTQPSIDANLTDNENSTALTIAMEAGHKDVGVILYKHLNFSKATSPRVRLSVKTKQMPESSL